MAVAQCHLEQAVFYLLFLAASTVSGMLLENIGTSIERGIDRCMQVEYLSGADSVWEHYLGLSCSDTYARKYLSTLVTRMKFINAMIPTLFFFGVGLVALNVQLGRWNDSVFVWLLLWTVALGIWLFRTSTELSEAALFARYKMLPQGVVSLDVDSIAPSRFRHFAYVLIELRSSRANEVDLRPLNWLEVAKEVGAMMIVAIPSERVRAKDPTRPPLIEGA